MAKLFGQVTLVLIVVAGLELLDSVETTFSRPPVDKYKAQCGLWQGQLKWNPDIFFFSTKGCYPGSSEEAVHISTGVTIDDLVSKRAKEFGAREHQARQINRKLLQDGTYKKELPTYFIVHDWMGDWINSTWALKVKDMILDEGDANVFVVDWSGGSNPQTFDFAAATTNTALVAKHVAGFIRHLLQLTKTRKLDTFHMIGEGLGAHISGFVGYEFGGKIGRITALDPSSNCLQRDGNQISGADSRRTGYLQRDRANSNRRLSTSSARLVVALHSDSLYYGINENVAHYDIYVNGGAQQPGCTFEQNPNYRCRHNYALKYVTPPANVAQSPTSQEDPEKCYLMAYRCSSWYAFQAGECGYCNDNDGRCTFSGLSLGQYPAVRKAPGLWAGRELVQTDVREGGHARADLIFNEETYPQSPDMRIDNPKNLRDSARHYIKTGDAKHTCRYQYQVIIAVEQFSDRNVADRTRFYLRLPVESGNERTWERANRLVQISHRVSDRSSSEKSIARSLKEISGRFISRIKHDFYTALITFNSTENCKHQSERVRCRPLDDLSATRLYSSTSNGLERVKYVAINYLSGLSKSTRNLKSYVLYPANEKRGAVTETRRLSSHMQQSWDRLKQSDGFFQGLSCALSNGRNDNCCPFGFHMDLESSQVK